MEVITYHDYKTQKVHYYCPFCAKLVSIVPFVLTNKERDTLEEVLKEHILRSHPIRWRLSRRFRKAMKLR